MPLSKRKGLPRLRVKARIASKVREKDLIEKAQLLMDDYELILPDCAEDCGSCPFKKTRARLEKISKYKDKPDKLAKFARRGDKLARAYAATIALAHEQKTPYLATATYPGGTITYVLRGKTPKEKLIGIQNFDSPKWRVLSVADLVQNKGLHFYSYEDSFVCTGRYSRPPEEYVKMAAEGVGAGKLDGNVFSCPHNPSEIDHMEFDWVSAGKKLVICDQCSAKLKNTLSKLSEGMAVPNVLSEFEISINRPLKASSGSDTCKDLLDRPVDKDLLDRYSRGELGNKDLIDKHMQIVHESLEELNKRAFAKGDKCYGEDAEAFVRDLTEDELERKALLGLLSNINHPVVLDQSDSVNKLLSKYWPSHGMDALKAVVPEEIAEKHFEGYDEESKSPLKAIRQAAKEVEHQTVVSKIPRFRGLSQYGNLADRVARAYKTSGSSGAVSVLDAEKSSDHRIRSIVHAFYLSLGITTKSWKFTDEEKEYGKHLQTYARKLLDSADQDQYHSALSDLLTQAGSTEELRRA